MGGVKPAAQLQVVVRGLSDKTESGPLILGVASLRPRSTKNSPKPSNPTAPNHIPVREGIPDLTGSCSPAGLHFALWRMVRHWDSNRKNGPAQGRIIWWAWRDSNSHVRRRQFLRLVCMQFHHRPMALRGRFEQPIVGLEATCVTIRIRSTLVGRAGFEPARFSRKVTGLQPSGFDHSPISRMSKNLHEFIAWKAGESNANVPGHTGKPAGIADIPRLPGRQLPIQ
jgi:hypothetical protein